MTTHEGEAFISLPAPTDASAFWRGIGPGMPMLQVTASGLTVGRSLPDGGITILQHVNHHVAAGDVVDFQKVEPGTFVATVNGDLVLTYTDVDELNAQTDRIAKWARWVTRTRVVATLVAIGVGAAIAAYALRYGISLPGVSRV